VAAAAWSEWNIANSGDTALHNPDETDNRSRVMSEKKDPA